MWLFLVACTHTRTVSYHNTGVACLHTYANGQSEVDVDFGPCPRGVYDSGGLWCSATIDGDRIEVEAGGVLVVYPQPLDTCGGIGADCMVDVPEGDWILSYAGRDTPVTTPAADRVCTGTDPAS